MFAKLKSLIGGNAAARANRPQQPAAGLITAYDGYGREIQIPRGEWLHKVLLPNLRRDWNDADALYGLMISALNDGFGSELLDASARLLELDRGRMPERGFVVRGIVLLENRDLQKARAVFEEGIFSVGRTAALLVNLAKVHSHSGDQQKADAILWEAVQCDPNLENGLGWWLSIERERHGDAGYVAALRRAIEVPRSWLPQLWLARDHLEHGRVEDAMALYREVLGAGHYSGTGLMMMSGDLGKNGHVRAIPDLLGPVYDPKRHDTKAGLNLLQAYLELERWQEGEELLHRLYELQITPIQPNLDRFASAFAQMKAKAESPRALPKDQISIQTLTITQPIWTYSLREPAWLLKPKSTDAPVVAFLALSNIKTASEHAERQSEDDLGRLTRAIPLYLAEAVHAWTRFSGHTLVNIAQNEAPVVFGAEVDFGDLADALPAGVQWVVVGSIEARDSTLVLRLRLWDQQRREIADTLEKTVPEDAIGAAVLQLEQVLLSRLGGASAEPWDAFYRRPSIKAMPFYLTALGQSFVLTLAANGIGSKDSIWGERSLVEWPLKMALQWPELETCKIMYVANLAKAHLYGSPILSEFRRKSLDFMRDLQRNDSVAAPLWPLVWKAVGADPNGSAESLPLPREVPGYEAWMEQVTRV